jgi:Zn-dependent peptidase ImmA (M78 family)
MLAPLVGHPPVCRTAVHPLLRERDLLHGVIVTRLRSGLERVDAFSRWFEGRPLVVLCADKRDTARSRLDAAHELGHLVMRHDAEPGETRRRRRRRDSLRYS